MVFCTLAAMMGDNQLMKKMMLWFLGFMLVSGIVLWLATCLCPEMKS